MKYSFMSFSCPEADFDRLLAIAGQYGYDGVEPRVESGHKHGIELDADGEFLAGIRKKASEGAVKISCIATSCKYADPQTAGENVEKTVKYIDLAKKTGAPRLRVFGGVLPEGFSREKAVELVVESLKKVSSAAEKDGVNVCIETHDDWCDPNHIAEVLSKVNHPRIKVNWDIMHPVRRAGVSIEDSFKILKDWVDHVHFHDGITTEDGKSQLVPIGSGVVDHESAVRLLSGASYGGYLSGEWINWEPCEVHLPREIRTMKGYRNS